MIVLRSPKGWGAPQEVGGHRLEGFWRAHQVPLTEVKKNPEQLEILEKWMRGYKPEEQSTAVVGVGTEYVDKGPSISVTQRVAGFDKERLRARA